jgi:SAM domain (Sterile alpha motif)
VRPARAILAKYSASPDLTKPDVCARRSFAPSTLLCPGGGLGHPRTSCVRTDAASTSNHAGDGHDAFGGTLLSLDEQDKIGRRRPNPGEGTAMDQTADWLEKLGMSEYAQRFAENGIGVAALRHLTDQDLKDIGVLLGHRRIMLAAIAALSKAAKETAQPFVAPRRSPNAVMSR